VSYPQNGDRIVTTDSVTSLHPMCTTRANMALQLHINVSLNRPPDRTWRRPPGRPRNRWLDQLRNDSTRRTGDLWRRAVDRLCYRDDADTTLADGRGRKCQPLVVELSLSDSAAAAAAAAAERCSVVRRVFPGSLRLGLRRRHTRYRRACVRV